MIHCSTGYKEPDSPSGVNREMAREEVDYSDAQHATPYFRPSLNHSLTHSLTDSLTLSLGCHVIGSYVYVCIMDLGTLAIELNIFYI